MTLRRLELDSLSRLRTPGDLVYPHGLISLDMLSQPQWVHGARLTVPDLGTINSPIGS